MKTLRYFFSLIVFFGLVGAIAAFIILFKPNTLNSEIRYLYIKTGFEFQDLLKSEEFNLLIDNSITFKWAAQIKRFKTLKPGRYSIKPEMSNQDLIHLLRSGHQEPILVSWSYVKTLAQLAGKISNQLEADSTELHHLLTSKSEAEAKGFDLETFGLMFLPNSYQFFWNTSAQEFVNRMEREYKNFWNEERILKAKNTRLTPIQVGILAAIVQSETAKVDEMPIVAGLYLNRLKQGVKLQADPTVIFAIKKDNPTQDIRRVLNKDLSYDSPYNTYVYSGLPPGPIRIPSTIAIDAVLSFKKHNYIYMCADPERPGYHTFTNDYNEHLLNGRKYHQWANKMNIKR